jgi:hypothetical protein
MLNQALADLIRFIATQLRALELFRARGNAERVQEIGHSSDDELIRKWLWVLAIVGAPACFIVTPFVISLLQPFLYPWLASGLWVVAKTSMVLVFLIFVLAAFFTHKSAN